MVFGTDCYSRAVRGLRRDCSALDSDESLSLAFQLTNCLFAKTGRRTYACAAAAERDVQECTRAMTPEDYAVFTQFVLNINAMCLFIANADFNRRAEATLNSLFKAGDVAAGKVRP